MSTGFLVTSLSGKLMRISDLVNQHVFKKLYIYVSIQKTKNIRNHEWVSKKIVDLYSSSFDLFPNLDVRIILNDLKAHEEKYTKLNDYLVDVIILPKNFDEEEICDFKNYLKNLYVVYIDSMLEEEEEKEDQSNAEKFTVYQNVVLGGTFDRLHTGHKILLSEALLRCSKNLTVGVTDGDMVKGKRLWELIEPCSKRINEVKKFIKEVDASIDYNVVPITDMYGPTKSDPNIEMIVVSSETHKGGHKVNELRKEKGLNELQIHKVQLAQDSRTNYEEEEKISSGNIRMRLLGTYLKKPEKNFNLPSKPYIIGLTGGIASGKSTVCEYLKTLGAAIINCDQIGHQLYKPGSSLYYELINIFGNQILLPNSEIDRKALGAIVFSDQIKLNQLNSLMWPAIYKAAKEECEKLYSKDKYEIVILEAAVLLRAGWHKNVHEVWTTIIPQNEAIIRIMKRNKLTEEEAKSRIDVQPSNLEMVEIANVVLCSLWSYEFTRSQVDKAWLAAQCSKNI